MQKMPHCYKRFLKQGEIEMKKLLFGIVKFPFVFVGEIILGTLSIILNIIQRTIIASLTGGIVAMGIKMLVGINF